MLLKKSWSLGIALILIFIVTGCEEEAISLENVEIPEKSEGFFWEAEHNNKTIYFLGTVHIGSEDMYPMRDEIEEAMAETELLLSEYDESNETIQNEYEDIRMEYTYLPSGEQLSDYLSDDHMDLVRNIEEELNIPYYILNSFKPWRVQSLYESMILSNYDYSYEQGVEAYLYSQVLEHAEGMALEDLETNIQSVRDRDLDYQLYLLEEVLEASEEEVEEEIESTVVAWRTGKESLVDLSRAVGDEEQIPEIKETHIEELLFNRDRQMAEKIDEVVHSHEAETIMIAAGYAHFFGPDNMIVLLEDEGYEIERK
ncbi:TraB/GumN family protein [Alkalibacillus aidingensis]|uniref:TraB/GumN family protein n=1 Tax=Alkalibacillus aidingensis TaxID=2747607 RepID=UPI0016604454|nr:TraB/GumN family protein [Alkalibacillus aidingensis]